MRGGCGIDKSILWGGDPTDRPFVGKCYCRESEIRRQSEALAITFSLTGPQASRFQDAVASQIPKSPLILRPGRDAPRGDSDAWVRGRQAKYSRIQI